MPKVMIGTSGFSYDDWHGRFYPTDLPKNQRLAYYVSRFHFLELNFTYYRMPSAKAIQQLTTRLEPGFQVTVKLHRSLTHELPATDYDLEERCSKFLSGLAPAAEKGFLSGILVQFPFRFHYDPENRRYLARLTDILRDKTDNLPRYIEFRTREWQRQRVVEEMARRELNAVLLDMPDLRGLPHSFNGSETIPTKAVYVRFHGRNRATWWSGDNVSRYDYCYSKSELRQAADAILSLVERYQLELITVAFNNHYRGQAPANASELAGLLAERGLTIHTR